MSIFSLIAIAYFLLASLHTFNKRLEQQKKLTGQDFGTLPRWFDIFSYMMYGTQIWLLLVDWESALALFAIAFILAVLPVLETIGNFLAAPLNWSKKTRNKTLEQASAEPDD